MQVYCQYSGISYEVENFANTKLEAVHPLFYASTKQLLSRAGDWAAQRLNEKERRILFLALMHSTELIEFRATAKPADHTVQLNMESLLKFVSWHSGIMHPAINFPRFAVTNETKDMQNCRHWLDAWWEARKDFEDGYKTQSQLAKLRNREVALERLIKTTSKKVEDYSRLLGQWAMDAAQVPAALHDYWISLFQLKGLHIYQAREVDLAEMLEHMEEYLEHGSIYSAATLKHVRMLCAKNKHGLNYGLGIPDEELANLDLDVLNASGFRILNHATGVQADNIKLGAINAPAEEPQLRQYPNRIAYLKAKAAWQLAQKAKEFAADAVGVVASLEQLNATAEAEINEEYIASGDDAMDLGMRDSNE